MDIEPRPPKNSLQDLQQRRATIASLVARLLNHYWTMDDPPEIRRAQADDWIADLVEFGPVLVHNACSEWRQTQTRRPTIADIRKLCIAEQWNHAEHYAIVDQRQDRWPPWLEEIWGPEPDGPRKRAAATILAGKTNP